MQAEDITGRATGQAAGQQGGTSKHTFLPSAQLSPVQCTIHSIAFAHLFLSPLPLPLISPLLFPTLSVLFPLFSPFLSHLDSPLIPPMPKPSLSPSSGPLILFFPYPLCHFPVMPSASIFPRYYLLSSMLFLGSHLSLYFSVFSLALRTLSSLCLFLCS